MSSLASYALDGPVATITMDDGKANALSLDMLTQVGACLDQAESDGAVVVLAGREGRFSAGFDLGVLSAGGPDAVAMVRAGFELSYRMLSFPTPIVVAATGHTIAMGVFVLLSGDYRIGASGPFKIMANEVALGITMPRAAIEICRQRLTPAHFTRAVILSELYSPDDAVGAGFLDRLVEPGEVVPAAQMVAAQLAGLHLGAHAATKLRTRASSLDALRAAIDADNADSPLGLSE